MRKNALVFGLILIILVFTACNREQECSGASFYMGTVVTEKLYGEQASKAVIGELDQEISRLEQQISWRIPESYTARLNQKGKVKCKSFYSEIVKACQEVYKDSKGAFDLSVGKLSTLWNIGTEQARVPKKSEIQKALPFVDGSRIKVSENQVRVGEGQFLDLGAIGKGYALDRIRKILKKNEITGACITVGGSILVYGDRNGDPTFKVGVRDPKAGENEVLGILSLQDTCVSTSGDYEHVFVQNGKTYHHILNPKTGYPTKNELVSVTIVCPDGLLSDALSTACFVLGTEKGMALVKQYQASGIFVNHDNEITLTEDLRPLFELTNDAYTIKDTES